MNTSEKYKTIGATCLYLGVAGVCVVAYQIHWAFMVTLISVFLFIFAKACVDLAKEKDATQPDSKR